MQPSSLRRKSPLPLYLLSCVALLVAACGPSQQPQITALPAKPVATSPLISSPSPAALVSPAPGSSPAAPSGPSPGAATTLTASPSPQAAPASAGGSGGGAGGATPSTLRMAFVPSADSAKVLASGKPIGEMLSRELGQPVDVSVPTSYAAVIEAMGANNVDVAWLAPLSYVLAHQKFGADVLLSSVRGGSKTYRAQIITPADSAIRDVKDIKGKKFAFVDAASASGFLYPSAMLINNGIDPKKDLAEVVTAGGHDKVVIAVYNRQVDAGATFGDSVEGGPPTDARTIVASTLPDVLDKVKVLARTDPIPNDTVSVRRGLSPELAGRIRTALLKIAETDAGKQQLRELYRIDGLSEASDRDYDGLRRVAQVVGLDLEEQFKPR